MKTSNIFKLIAMLTYNQHNYGHCPSQILQGGKKPEQNRKEGYNTYIFKGQLFVFCQPITFLGML